MVYRFDRFQADDTDFRLTSGGQPIPLEPKTLRLLLYLIENRNRLVRKQDLLDAVWQEANVTEGALTRAIGLLRKALDDDSREPRFIETVPTVGYRFIAEVNVLDTLNGTPHPQAVPQPAAPQPPQPQPTQHHLVHSNRSLISYAVLAAIIVLAGAAAGWVVYRHQRAGLIHSLAVLPLANLSGDPGQDYFADGMTDELITELARIPNLRVVSHTSVMQYKGTRKTISQIATELSVDAIVEGSVVRSGDRVRITAQLIDTRTDRHLWAQSFEGSPSDILSLQDSVSSQIASHARAVLLPAPPASRTINPAAHDAYLHGRYFFNKQDFLNSTSAFEHAIALDPRFASAYAGYAAALDAQAVFDLARLEDAMPKALAATQKAIALDPTNGEAYAELGSIQTIYTWDWTAAEQNLKRAIELAPSYSLAQMKYSAYLDAVGRTDEAVTAMRRAVNLDPLSFLMNRRLGAALYLARRYDDALAQLQIASRMEPDQPATFEQYISLVYEEKGMRDQAVAHDLVALHATQPGIDTTALQEAYKRDGWQGYWRARISALSAQNDANQPCLAYEIGSGYVRIGDRDQAFRYFNQAIDQHCFYVVFFKADPILDPIRTDPRFAALLHRINQT